MLPFLALFCSNFICHLSHFSLDGGSYNKSISFKLSCLLLCACLILCSVLRYDEKLLYLSSLFNYTYLYMTTMSLIPSYLSPSLDSLIYASKLCHSKTNHFLSSLTLSHMRSLLIWSHHTRTYSSQFLHLIPLLETMPSHNMPHVQ